MLNDDFAIKKEQMLKKYLEMQLTFVDLTDYVENKLKNLLIENKIRYQSISGRTKSYESLKGKLTKKMADGIHNNILKMNDLSGVRVVFYNDDDLKSFISIIRSSFNNVKIKNSDDIREYDGVNITVTFDNISHFRNLNCEIQLTNIISYAVNEFRHDIIYKDLDELENKNKKEYERICKDFEKIRDDSLKLLASMQIIEKRVDAIKEGSLTITHVMSSEFIDRINSTENLIDLEQIINEMIAMIPIINDDDTNEKINSIISDKLVSIVVERFISLPEESSKILSYDTYEYKFDKLFEFLNSYLYLWIDDFKNIVDNINNKIKKLNNTRIKERFYKFIEECLLHDKVSSNKYNMGFQVHELFYKYILDKNDNNELKIVMAKSYCNFNYSYTEQNEQNPKTINFINARMTPNSSYINKTKDIINKCFSIFIKEQIEYNFSFFESVLRQYEDDNTALLKKLVFDLFDSKYEIIDFYYMNKIYSSSYHFKSKEMLNHNLFEKLNNDNLYKLTSYLLFDFSIDLVELNYNDKEKVVDEYIKNYIQKLSVSDIDDIIKICNIVANHKEHLNNNILINRFLVSIGSELSIGKEVYKKTQNSAVLIGILSKDHNYNFKLEKVEDAINLANSTYIIGTSKTNIMDILIDNIKRFNTYEFKQAVGKVIFGNINYFKYRKYRYFIIKVIKEYNYNSTPFMNNIYIKPNVEEYIINNLTKCDIETILENITLSEITWFNEQLLIMSFEKYPELVRKIIKENIYKDFTFDYYRDFSDLSEASNYKNQLSQNLDLCLEILHEKDWFKVRKHIKFLLGAYNDVLEKEIINSLNSDCIYYKEILDLCRILDISMDGWKIFEIIIEKDDNQELLLEISNLLFGTIVGSGEYGIADAYRNKYEFLNKLKPKNEKVKMFVYNQKERFKQLYLYEKGEVDKQIIRQETEWQIKKLENQ